MERKINHNPLTIFIIYSKLSFISKSQTIVYLYSELPMIPGYENHETSYGFKKKFINRRMKNLRRQFYLFIYI